MAINFPNTPSINDTFVSGNTTYIWDGVVWKVATLGFDSAEAPYEIPFHLTQSVIFNDPDAILSTFVFTQDVIIRTTSPSLATAGTPGGTQQIFTLKKNNTTIGTVTYAALATTGTVVINSNTTFAAGDELNVIGPAGPDNDIDDVAFTIVGGITIPVNVISTSPMTVNTDGSLTGVGTLAVPLKLTNDEVTPGNSRYYGTNVSGVKGWYSLTGVEVSSVAPTNDTPPGTPSDGELWWNSATGKLMIYYDDGSSSQWVDASPINAASGSNVAALDDLTDVTAAGSVTGTLLYKSAGDWLPTAPNLAWNPSLGELDLINTSGVASLQITALGDAFIRIEADTDNVTEGDNAYILMLQDGGAVEAEMGLTGDAGIRPSTGSAFPLAAANFAANDFVIASDQPINIIPGNGTSAGTVLGLRLTNTQGFTALPFRVLRAGTDITSTTDYINLSSDGGNSAITMRALGDCVINIEADTNDVTESDNAYIKFSQDNGVTVNITGLTGDANTIPDGTSVTNVVANDFVIFQKGVGGITIGANNIGMMRFATAGTTITNFVPLITLASSATAAGLNLPHGAAPNTPTNGDIWTTSGGIYAQINGVTQGFVPDTRQINTTSPLTGGGDLSATRTLSISANGIGNSLLRQGSALSVIGRSANSTGNVSDIAATPTSGAVLRESGSTIGWGEISTAGIGDSQVTLGKLAQISSSRILGRVDIGTGDVQALTGTQATSILDVFTNTLKGLVPSSGGGTLNFLRADGTWAEPPGGGGGGGGGGGSSLPSPDTPPATPSTYDDEFDDGTFNGASPQIWSQATAYSQGTAPTITEGRGAVTFELAGGNTAIAYKQTLAGSPNTFKIRSKVRMSLHDSGNPGNSFGDAMGQYHSIGIFAAVNGTDKIVINMVMRFTGGMYVGPNRATGTTFSTNNMFATTMITEEILGTHGLYLELEGDGTNLICRASLSGYPGTWTQIHSETYAGHLGAAPDEIGIVVLTGGNATGMYGTFEWFRAVEADYDILATGVADAFDLIEVTDTDTGFSWSETGTAIAVGADTLTLVSGSNVDIDVDSTNKAIRISSTGGGPGGGGYPPQLGYIGGF